VLIFGPRATRATKRHAREIVERLHEVS